MDRKTKKYPEKVTLFFISNDGSAFLLKIREIVYSVKNQRITPCAAVKDELVGWLGFQGYQPL